MKLMQSIRTVLAVLTASVLLAAGTLPAAAQEAPRNEAAAWKFLAGLPRDARLPVLEREARREGSLVIYGALGIDRANLFIKSFQDRYPGIKVDFVRLREPELVEKSLLEGRTNRVNADIAISNVPWLQLLKPALAPYEPTTWGSFDQRLRRGSVADGWTAVVYEILPSTIAWRTDRVRKEEAPRTLDEMANPKWKGRAGTTSHVEAMMDGLVAAYGEKEGMAKSEKLAALDNRLYPSIAALSDALSAGEIDIAWNMGAHRSVQLKGSGAPVDYVFQDPLLGVGITVSAVKGAPHYYAAALLMEHLTSAPILEQLDKAEGGRIFGNNDGNYALKLSEFPNLVLFDSIDQSRFRELKQIAERLFIRRR